VYVSKATVPFDDAALTELAAKASVRNAEIGVTGYLYFEKDRFVQYIEGDTPDVTELMSRIEKDSRHEVLHQIHADDVAKRRFPSWGMKKLVHSDLMEIRLEHLLTDHLLFLHKLPGNKDNWGQSVWRMVERISEFQTRLGSRRA
jgi:hypothetical protein